jgi:predicted permease
MPVNAEYFMTLGATPDVGRPFTRDEERPGINRVILSRALWRSIAAGRSSPLGASVELDGRQYEIIGLMRAGFRDPGGTNVAAWIPQNLMPGPSNLRGNYYLSAIARLAPGVSLPQARADVERIMNRVRATLPASDSALANSIQLAPLLDDVVGDSRTPMYILMGAATLVLLIACINVASLFLARSVTLTHESAIRTALGAARSRLIAQRLTESLLIAGAGGLLGSIIAVSGVKVLLLVSPDSVARAENVGFNPVLLAFGLGATLFSAVLFGIAPALRASRADPADALHEHSRGNTSGRRAGYARNVLVASQVALALMLLVGAGVLLRSFAALEHTDLGFDPGHIATFDVNLPNARYGTPAQRAQAHHRLHDALAAIPGVTSVGATSWLPGNGPYHSWGYTFVDASGARQSAPVQVRVIDGDFFGAFRVKPSSGSVLMRAGFADTIRDVVVNQSLAHRAFGDAVAIGRTLYLNGDLMRVAGVVPNLAFDARGSVADQIYLSHDEYANNRNWTLTYVVRTTAEAPSVVSAARAAIASVDPQLVMYEPTTMDDVLSKHRAPQEFTLLLMGIFGAVALTLAAVGVYGVLSYAVTQRTHEIGVRIALGAPATSVRAIVARQAALVAGAGMVVGLAAAFVLGGLLRSIVFGVSVRDPAVFGVVTVTLAAVIAVASYGPARRATRIEPLEALRGE